MKPPNNPYIAGNPIRDKERFFGRQDTLDWVDRELRNPHTNALVLFGQRRIGKTSLFLQLQQILPREYYLPIYFDLQDQASRPLGQVLADLANEALDEIEMKSIGARFFDDEGHFFLRTFLPKFYSTVLKHNVRPVFLLDEFDVLEQNIETELQKTAAGKALFPFLRRILTKDTRSAFIFAVGRRAEDLSLRVGLEKNDYEAVTKRLRSSVIGLRLTSCEQCHQ